MSFRMWFRLRTLDVATFKASHVKLCRFRRDNARIALASVRPSDFSHVIANASSIGNQEATFTSVAGFSGLSMSMISKGSLDDFGAMGKIICELLEREKDCKVFRWLGDKNSSELDGISMLMIAGFSESVTKHGVPFCAAELIFSLSAGLEGTIE